MIYVLSGPSGVGKSSLVREVIKRDLPIHIPVSCTTRAKKIGEKNGVDYHFLGRETFERLAEAHLFAEWEEVHGNLYGTLRFDLDSRQLVGPDVLLEIDCNGASQIKSKFEGVKTVFVLPPSFSILEDRIRSRNRGETEDEVRRRLDDAQCEMCRAGEFDHRIVNSSLEAAFKELLGILKLGI